MAFENRKERGEAVWTPGVPVVFKIPAGQKVLRGTVILDGTVVVSGGTTSGAAIGDNALGPVGLVRHISVDANRAAGSLYRGGQIVRCHPSSLLRFAMKERSGKYVSEYGASTLGNGAAGAYPIYLEIPIYFADTSNKNNVQTALNMDPADSNGNPIYTSVQVKIDLAAAMSELFEGNDRAMAIAGIVRWKDDRLALTTDSTPMFQEDHDLLILAAQDEFPDGGLPNDGALMDVLIQAQANGPQWTLADTILEKVKMYGSTISFEEHVKSIRMNMIDDGMFDPSATLTGLYDLDFMHGLLANSNPIPGLGFTMRIANPSGSGLDRLRIYTRRVYPLAA